MRDANYWIKHLNLLPHPEGGYFREVYRSDEKIKGSSLPDRFTNDRHINTSIYFLLCKDMFSAFHRIKSDEIWHFYDGDHVSIYMINDENKLITYKLGLLPEKGILPQITIPANNWFASESTGDFSLVGCTVSPGFNFNDFEMGDRNSMIYQYPKHRNIIERLTKPKPIL